MAERRYSEDEIARIFRQATEAQQNARRQLPPGEGLTLAELQAIGEEVGLPSQLVVRAARTIDQPVARADRRFLGLPIRVGHAVELERPLTDAEWEHLVVDLRQTFDARGRIRADGSFREWTNGNLQVLVEPTAGGGHRIRMRTLKGDARALMTTGVAGVVGGASVLLLTAVTGGLDAGAAAGAAFLSLFGLGTFVAGAVRVPLWARRRRQQMEGIAARLVLATDEPPSTDG